MNRKTLYMIGGVLLVAFAGFALTSFRDTLTPYVSFEQARAATRVVQVAGGLDQGSSSYDAAAGALRFTLLEPEGAGALTVRYHGVKPANFEDAISIVAIGTWDEGAGEFAADSLLVKCPSKYQGAEVETKEYS
jgi:cytochrome c-type biogenesis protein CcmE